MRRKVGFAMSELPCPLRFNAADADRAFDTWGANCGPGAIAAICGLTLDELRPHLGDFEQRRYTNPALMYATLHRLGVKWHDVRRPKAWPRHGLVRIQWWGPWMERGVPGAARYRYTHWVGACMRAGGNVGVFDINAIGNGAGWCALKDWAEILVPHILKEAVPRASGKWSIATVIEVEP